MEDNNLSAKKWLKNLKRISCEKIVGEFTKRFPGDEYVMGFIPTYPDFIETLYRRIGVHDQIVSKNKLRKNKDWKPDLEHRDDVSKHISNIIKDYLFPYSDQDVKFGNILNGVPPDQAKQFILKDQKSFEKYLKICSHKESFKGQEQKREIWKRNIQKGSPTLQLEYLEKTYRHIFQDSCKYCYNKLNERFKGKENKNAREGLLVIQDLHIHRNIEHYIKGLEENTIPSDKYIMKALSHHVNNAPSCDAFNDILKKYK